MKKMKLLFFCCYPLFFFFFFFFHLHTQKSSLIPISVQVLSLLRGFKIDSPLIQYL